MNLSKKIGLAVIVILILLGFSNFQLISYGIAQLHGQLNIIFYAEDFTAALYSEEYSTEQKEKIKFIAEIKRFAIDSLGLKESKSYQKIYNQHNKDVLWTVTACEAFEFKEYQWYFPFLGSVPYKGFFNYKKGKSEANEIKSKGFDVEYSAVSGWSTLGWFGDPILSNMLKRSEGSLADLIIHELTHSTIYIKNEVDYNENLATFIGNKGALLFLNSKYGINSKESTAFLILQKDRKKYVSHILRGTNHLDSLYSNFKPELNSEQKNRIKNENILRIITTIDTLQFLNPKKFKWDFEKNELPNNTFFMSYLRYRKKQNSFDAILESKFDNDIRKLIKHIKIEQKVID